MSEELKPCPFCGEDAAHTESSYFRDVLIYCENCDAYFTVDSFAADEKDVIEAWNRRAKPEERVVRVRPRGRLTEWAGCECGQAVHMGWSYCPFCGAKLERK